MEFSAVSEKLSENLKGGKIFWLTGT